MTYAVVIERTDNGYSGYVPDLPGCVAAGDSYEETERSGAGTPDLGGPGRRTCSPDPIAG